LAIRKRHQDVLASALAHIAADASILFAVGALRTPPD
jgi:hypothetical protein